MKITFRDAAIEVLTERATPLSVPELWSAILARELVDTTGGTPEQTLHTTLLRATVNASLTRGDANKVFVRVGPGRFGLAAWGIPPEVSPTSPRPSATVWKSKK